MITAIFKQMRDHTRAKNAGGIDENQIKFPIVHTYVNLGE